MADIKEQGASSATGIANDDVPNSKDDSCPAADCDSLPHREVGSIEAAEEGRNGEQEKPAEVDRDLVTWDGDDDPLNPHNFSVRKKVGITSIWVIGNIVTTIASSIFASGALLIEAEFDISPVVATLGVSLFLLVCKFRFAHLPS